MKLYPAELRRVGPSRYAVRIDVDGSERTYEFSVVGETIRCVVAAPEFNALVHRNGGPVKQLFAAVLAFDLAQGAEIPD